MGEQRRMGPYNLHNIADHAQFRADTGLDLGHIVQSFKKYNANCGFFLEHFVEIMGKYKGCHVFIDNQKIYSVETPNNEETREKFDAFMKDLKTQGFDDEVDFHWYVPKDDDPDNIRQYWIHPPWFVTINQAARLLEEKDRHDGQPGK